MNEAIQRIKSRILDLHEEIELEKNTPMGSPSYYRYLVGNLDGYNNALYILEQFGGVGLDQEDKKEKE